MPAKSQAKGSKKTGGGKFVELLLRRETRKNSISLHIKSGKSLCDPGAN